MLDEEIEAERSSEAGSGRETWEMCLVGGLIIQIP